MEKTRKLLANFGDPKDQKKFDRIPNVMMFQPTSYEVVTPDKLHEFERLVADRVGLDLDINESLTSYTVSCCPDCDDCDE